MTHDEAWPPIDVADWAQSKRTVHLCLQMLGKLRLHMSPPQPNWLFSALLPNARGFTTGPMPVGSAAVEASLDVFDSRFVFARSTGEREYVDLVPARTIAEIYAAVLAALSAVGVAYRISTTPQEIADQTPFDDDRRPTAYDPDAVRRWFAATTSTAGVFDRWRSRFFGRTGIQLWWGALDLSLMLFSGKHAEAPRDRGYLLRYDMDAELMNVGLFVGDERTLPFFYGYTYPQSADAETARIAPSAASWSRALSEWVLPYAAVRDSATPHETLTAFLDDIYAVCVDANGWDREALSYDVPPAHRLPHHRPGR